MADAHMNLLKNGYNEMHFLNIKIQFVAVQSLSPPQQSVQSNKVFLNLST